MLSDSLERVRYQEKTPPKFVLAFAVVYLAVLAVVRLSQGRFPSTGDEWLPLLYLHAPILLLVTLSARFLFGTRFRIRITDNDVRYYRLAIPLSEIDPASVAQARAEADWPEAARRKKHWPDESEASLSARDLELSNEANRIRRELAEGTGPDRLEALRERAAELEAEAGRIYQQKLFYHPRKGLESVFFAKKDGSMVTFYSKSARDFTEALARAVR